MHTNQSSLRHQRWIGVAYTKYSSSMMSNDRLWRWAWTDWGAYPGGGDIFSCLILKSLEQARFTLSSSKLLDAPCESFPPRLAAMIWI
ncbi:hypothetical protein CPSG_06948 [Coccidioides posadasii str. Silveira]|uniref:Uncharacterized protein n=1 Tax=Coccidioides posadasii (strain RMSCC 757 / Silveira) TaxID=443226 RepID=E9DAU6_COCPS|nr:hypothetical protein CPSG_06948 [Coccidioides posadasii str. Silveira]